LCIQLNQQSLQKAVKSHKN
uniref:Uncharacterized protein n=1 Tax=Amphimedon queenslandica TaxID=400682 RepID=A0A1X7VNQ4_AMPQE